MVFKRIFSVFAFLVFLLTGINTLPDRELIKIPGGVMEICERSTVFPAEEKTWGVGANSATVTELCASEENKGTLLCSFAVYDSGIDGKTASFRIMKSEDGGKSWHMTAQLFESMCEGTEASFSPCLFELPEDLGDMKKGTVILGGTSIDPAHSAKTTVSLYKSTDGGETFTEYAVIAEGGGIENGIWEPYFVYENGALYCFYSDETDPGYSQKLVYRKSTDGVNFSEAVDFIALNDKTERPGMLTMTKTGDGKFFAVYEICNSEKGGAPVYYKTFADIENTDASDKGTLLKDSLGKGMHSAPVCLWNEAGGKNGTLFVISKASDGNKIFVSNNMGKSFKAVKNPIEYSSADGMGYKCSLFSSYEDGKIYYVNTDEAANGKADIEFTALKISSVKDFSTALS